MTNTLRLELFGGFRLAEGTTPLSSFTYSKGKALLAFLAVTGQPCGRETLAALLWSDLPDSEARTNLRVVLSNLRQFLAPYLLITRETVGLNPQHRPWIDVEAFQQALDQSHGAADIGQLRAAVALYRGDLLAGFAVPGASAFDEWVVGQRERLRQLALFTLHELAAKYVARRTYLAGIETLNQILTLDPWREEAHRQLIELYAHSGQRSAALAQYAICRQVLADELGVAPADETQALYQAIMANRLDARGPDGTLMTTPRPTEPGGADRRPSASAGPPLVGRSAELARLRAVWRGLAATGPRLVVLSGEAGIGKTRLAEEFVRWADGEGSVSAAARAYAAEGSLAFSPVAAWLRSPLVAARLEHLPEVWLRDVARLVPEVLITHPALPDPGPLTGPAERERLFAALAHTMLLRPSASVAPAPLVLILDDLQWCDRDTLEWLRYLLRSERTAHLLLIGTLRNDERADNPHLLPLLTALTRDGQLVEMALERLTLEETAALAARLAGDDLDAPALARIVRETQGNPLFVVESLRPAADTAGAHTIQAIIAARLARLSPRAREVAHIAAAIGHACSYAVLVHATGKEEELVEALDELCARQIFDEQGGDQYRFGHDKVREVAYGALRAARRRLIHRRIAEALTAVRADDLDVVSGEIGAHYERAGLPERAIPWYRRAGEIAQRLAATHEAIRLVRHALDLLRALPTTAQRLEQERDLLLVLGPLLVVTHSFTDQLVAATYTRAHDISRELEHGEASFASLWGLWFYYSARGALPEARGLTDQLLALGTPDGEPQAFLQARHAAWSMAIFQGELDQTRRYVAEGLARYDPARDHAQSLRYGGHDPAICGIGHDAKALWLSGYPGDAFGRLAELLALAERLNHPPSLAHALESAMRVSHFHRDTTRVREYASKLLALPHDATSPWQTPPLVLQGWALAVRGGAPEGIAQIERGLVALRAEGMGESWSYYQSMLAEGYLLVGRAEEALQILAEALAVATASAWWVPELYRLQGEGLLALPTPLPDEATASFRRAIAVAQSQGARALELRAAVSLYRLTAGTGGEDDGRRALETLVGWFGDGQASPDLLEARELLARR
jgi:DNA-binding SARP family transcriptional activator/predicted ATPase